MYVESKSLADRHAGEAIENIDRAASYYSLSDVDPRTAHDLEAARELLMQVRRRENNRKSRLCAALSV